MKYAIMNVDGRTVIIDNDEFINSGDYSAVPLSLENVCKLMNDRESQKKRIEAIIQWLNAENSNGCFDYSIYSNLHKQISGLLN